MKKTSSTGSSRSSGIPVCPGGHGTKQQMVAMMAVIMVMCLFGFMRSDSSAVETPREMIMLRPPGIVEGAPTASVTDEKAASQSPSEKVDVNATSAQVLLQKHEANSPEPPTKELPAEQKANPTKQHARLREAKRSPADARVLFLPAERRGHGGFRFVHIPKAAGELFMSYARKEVDDGEKKLWQEHCLLGKHEMWKSYDPEKDFAAAIFRSPRAHVLSQYFQCEQGWGGMYEREYTKFPRAFPKGSLSLAERRVTRSSQSLVPSTSRDYFKKLYRKAISNMDRWLDFFLNDWELEKGYFACYHPLSMQVRAMTCTGPWDWMHGILREEYLTPDVDQAIANMRSLWFVGLAEHIHESFCMWEYQYRRELPVYCDCASGVQRQPLENHVHNVARHSVSDLSPSQLEKIDLLTEGDKRLYEAAYEEFMLRLRKVEAQTGKTIMCSKK